MRVVGGGCSGLRYELAFDDQIRDVDTPIEVNGVRVILDEKSALYLAGTDAGFRGHAPGIRLQDQQPERLLDVRLRESFSA
jgi:iron-sulfur cluster assembly protein